MEKRIESMQIGVAAVDDARADGYRKGHLSALREVRNEVERRARKYDAKPPLYKQHNDDYVSQRELELLVDTIDAMIAKEER